MKRWHRHLVRCLLPLLLLMLPVRVSLAFLPTPETGLEVHQHWLERARLVPLENAVPSAHDVATTRSTLPGDWTLTWNRLSDAPRRLVGGRLEAAPGGFADHQQVDQVSRTLVAAHPAFFGVDPSDIAPLYQAHAARHWSVLYRQTHAGLPVEGARLEFLYTEDGGLVMLGSTAQRAINVDMTPALTEEAAQSAGQRGLPAAQLASDGAPELWILPVPQTVADREELTVTHYLAYRMIFTTAEPPGRWVTWVDAHSGKILWRTNDVRFLAISGQVIADTEDFDYCAGVESQPLANQDLLVVGVGNTRTDAEGHFTVADPSGLPRVVQAGLNGAHVTVTNFGGIDALFLGQAEAGEPLSVEWNDANSQPDERDVYLHTDRVYRFIRGIDPTTSLGLLDVALPANVSIPDVCNAFWNGSSINFYIAGGGCANSGRIGDIIYHEYGHGVTQFIYTTSQPPDDVHEGNSDIIATHLTERSLVGNGFSTPCGSGLRDCDNQLRYPEDVVGQDGHSAGRVICGFDWDVRKGLEQLNPAIFASHSDSLWHYSRVLVKPMDQPLQVLTYFMLDDDDGYLPNSTPHYDALCAAAENHGFELYGPAAAVAVTIDHPARPSTTDTLQSYPVTATITSSAAPIDPATTLLRYRLNGGAEVELPLLPTATSDQYQALIPPQAVGTRVGYGLVAEDTDGNVAAQPLSYCHPEEPAGEEVFHVASTLEEFEGTPAWIVGSPGDDAVSGIWELVDPNGTTAQPEDDRTPGSGHLCFVTGQHTPGEGAGFNDIDGGRTTLTSPIYDLSAYPEGEVLYHRWFSNDAGSNPGEDYWVVDASNDGGETWTNIENTNVSAHIWTEVRVDLRQVFGTAPDRVMLRFIAGDYGLASLVEAAVDDFMIFAYTESAPVELASFTATSADGAVMLRWRTAWETDHLGFNLLRAGDGGVDFEQVNERLIAPAGEHGGAYEYVDDGVAVGATYEYRLESIGRAGERRLHGPWRVTVTRTPPPRLVLGQSRPNPFRPTHHQTATIGFELPEATPVRLRIYGATGRLVRTLVDAPLPPGAHARRWDGRDQQGASLVAGVYYLRLDTPGQRLTRKLVLLE